MEGKVPTWQNAYEGQIYFIEYKLLVICLTTCHEIETSNKKSIFFFFLEKRHTDMRVLIAVEQLLYIIVRNAV